MDEPLCDVLVAEAKNVDLCVGDDASKDEAVGRTCSFHANGISQRVTQKGRHIPTLCSCSWSTSSTVAVSARYGPYQALEQQTHRHITSYTILVLQTVIVSNITTSIIYLILHPTAPSASSYAR